MPLEKKILNSLKHQRLIQSNDKILLGVSGGSDSIALLYLLNDLKTHIGFQIHVGHINHHLRATADADQKFVKKICASLNLPCTCVELDLASKMEHGGSLEEIARRERFSALITIAKKVSANAIALAHQSDDLAETVLLRILRGSGLQGLQAILPKRTIDSTVFIRPLLKVSRDEIQMYLKKNKIKFRNDPTNKQTHFFRNKIRLKLLPSLEKEYQPNIKELLCSLALTAGEDYAYIRQEALKIFPTLTKKRKATLKITLAQFHDLPVALKRMTLRLAVENLKGNTRTLTLTHLLELNELIEERPAGSIVNLPNGLCVKKTQTFLIFDFLKT